MNNAQEGRNPAADNETAGEVAEEHALAEQAAADSGEAAEAGPADQRISELTESLLRARADVENMRRRCERDVANAHRYGLERFAAELLPIKDSLELGLAAAGQGNASIDGVREGLELTLKMLADALQKAAVAEINPLGDKFDPEKHQAMQMQETDEAEPNTVIMVHQKGYILHDRLIRPAMVVVAKARSQ